MSAGHVVVIGGPIASGKSTVARAVARLFELQRKKAAVIDLDLIYEMLEHGHAAVKDHDLTWTRARRAAAALTDALINDGVELVIAEGDFLDESSRKEFTSALVTGSPVLFVTLLTPLAVALERVKRDPTRGISREPEFLTRHYERSGETLRQIPRTDVVLDTSSSGIDETADAILTQLG